MKKDFRADLKKEIAYEGLRSVIHGASETKVINALRKAFDLIDRGRLYARIEDGR